MRKPNDDRTEPETDEWVMPAWMEPYRPYFQNTGGNSIEELMNDRHTNGFNNLIRAGLICSVDSQVTLLHRLARRGMLADLKACPSVGKAEEYTCRCQMCR